MNVNIIKNNKRMVNFLFFLKSNFSILKNIIFEKFETNKSELNKNGIIIKRRFVSAEVIKSILKKIQQLEKNSKIIKKGTTYNIRKSYDGKKEYDIGMIDIINYHNTETSVLKYIKMKEIEKIISLELKEKLNFDGLNIYINKSVTETRSFHVDSFGAKQHKAFIYLTDVDEDAKGPYCYIKGSHKNTFNKIFNLWYNYINKLPLTDMRKYKGKKITKCLGNKGDLIISSQDGYHRGWPQKEKKERYLIAIKFKKC